MRRSPVRSSVSMSLDHRVNGSDATLRRELVRLARQMVFGTIAERERVCGKPTCRCAQGEKHPAVQLVHWAGAGENRGAPRPAAAGRVGAGIPSGRQPRHRGTSRSRGMASYPGLNCGAPASGAYY